MEGDFAAIAVVHVGKQVLAIAATIEPDLGDAREVAADDVAIRAGRCAELVEPHGLVELPVGRRAFAFPRVARVVEAGVVRHPLDTATCGRISHAWNDIGQTLARCHVVDVRRAHFAAVGRQRYYDAFAVIGRLVEIDRRSALGVQNVGIEEDRLLRDVAVGRQHDEHRLVRRRRQLHRKQVLAELKAIARDGLRAQQCADSPGDLGPLRDAVQVGARQSVLCIDPRLHVRRVVVLEPAVVIGDCDAVVACRRSACERSGDRSCRRRRWSTRRARAHRQRRRSRAGGGGWTLWISKVVRSGRGKTALYARSGELPVPVRWPYRR